VTKPTRPATGTVAQRTPFACISTACISSALADIRATCDPRTRHDRLGSWIPGSGIQVGQADLDGQPRNDSANSRAAPRPAPAPARSGWNWQRKIRSVGHPPEWQSAVSTRRFPSLLGAGMADHGRFQRARMPPLGQRGRCDFTARGREQKRRCPVAYRDPRAGFRAGRKGNSVCRSCSRSFKSVSAWARGPGGGIS
jgi:hypothetical protein